MRVLVFGASGSIGRPVAQALARAGHSVIGQTRSESNATSFYKDEIEPLVIDADANTAWTKLIPTLDAVIDCSSGDNLREIGVQKFERTQAAARQRHPTAAKLVYVYTSGTWVHGKSAFETHGDGAALLNSAGLTAWRATDIEVPLRNSDVLSGIVIRPSMVYGRQGSIFSMVFSQAATKKEIQWAGSPTTTLSTIHVDDLASLYVLSVEKANIAKGLAFDASVGHQESQHLIFQRLAELEGFPVENIKYHEPSNPFEEALITSRPLRPSAGRALLGWQPLRGSISDALPVYYNAFKAHNGIETKSYLPAL